MKYLKLVLKVVFIIFILVLSVFIINFLRLDLSYRLNKYDEVYDIQGIVDNYVPQGLTYSSKYNVILQTSYNSKHNCSMLYVTDFDSGVVIKELKLMEVDGSNNTNHVGGITTNEEIVWITNDYEINEYSLDDIVSTNNDYIMSIKNTKLANRGDFCGYKDNVLWVGDFFLNPFYKVPDNNPLLMGYKLDSSIDYNKPDYVISLPKMVQGMVITPDNKFVFSESFTYLIKSNISIYSNVLNEKDEIYSMNGFNIPYYKFGKNNLIKKIKVPPMAEGMFYKDDKLYILFENGSDSYSLAFPKIKKIIRIDISNYLY